MKQKLKEGDVVMILPHTSGMTQHLIDHIAIVDRLTYLPVLGEYIYAIKVNFDEIYFESFYSNELLKIGTL